MKLYKISQEVNNNFDTYDSAIVCAENEEEAKKICPDKFYKLEGDEWVFRRGDGSIVDKRCYTWCDIKYVTVEYIGEAKKELKKGIILASFNAG